MSVERGSILLVDDRPQNLLALEAILEPLDVRTVRAESGEAALRRLLEDEFAVILLDVQMPGLDGFETATLIKARERTRRVPIIFLTAISKDNKNVFEGYEAGAIDYMFKPFEPVILRSKVAAFTELWRQGREIERQAVLLREAEGERRRHEVDLVRRVGEERYRDLADAMPAVVFTLDACGAVGYVNERWRSFAGETAGFVEFADPGSPTWNLVHSFDRPALRSAWIDAIASPHAFREHGFVTEVRLRRRDRAWRWHLVRAIPRYHEGHFDGWVGTATDTDATRRSEERQRVLAEAGSILGSSRAWREELGRLADVIVPRVADWCSIDVLDSNGDRTRVALRCDGSVDVDEAQRLAGRFDADREGTMPARVIELRPAGTHGGVLLADGHGAEVADDAASIRAIAAPLVVRGEVVGAITLAVSGEERELGAVEQLLVRELAARTANVVDAARLLEAAEQRARAAEVLATIADGVFLVDRNGVIALWNRSAEAITGLAGGDVIGQLAGEAIPGWRELQERIPVQPSSEPVEGSIAETVPVDVNGREIWLSISGVTFDLGTAYAFRDITEERTVERLKSDFVATVSHELRTPLASIYGAAATLQRTDIDLDERMRNQLLAIISEQSQQLADIVNDVLTASRIEAGTAQSSIRNVDAMTLAREAVEATRVRAGDGHTVTLEGRADMPAILADSGHLRQVLGNLLDNAVKYSPKGGTVCLAIEECADVVRFAVKDQGVGIAATDQRRIFEKFYRVDANMSLGIGGTGLGLFICRELVRQMDGRIWLSSTPGAGTTFFVELQAASGVHGGEVSRDRALG